MIYIPRLTGNNAVETLLEPRDGLLGADLVGSTDTADLLLAAGDTHTGAAHDDVEVHTEDTDSGVVLDTEVDVLVDTEAEVAGLREVTAAELVLLDLEGALKDLLGLGAADGDVDSDLLVTTDRERTDGVASLRGDGGLTSELLEHLGGTSKTVTRLSDGDVCTESAEGSHPGRTQLYALMTSFSMRSSFMGLTGALLASA